jgi:hypothetical protein
MVMPQFLARIARALGFSVASPHKVFIRVSPQNGVAFWPDVENATANQPLRASDKDNVSWTNETNQLVTLASVTPSDVLNFRRVIPAGESSSFYSIDIKTPLPITYRCEQHPQVHMIEDAASPLVALNQAAIDNG